ncbi:hypothetical protein HMPREF9078_02169 [Capnocytophaga sp. oral taxon 380 str. F0488]|nr:hypothetical protein HMPREF9078_02169 [Capnocytophaga sp. oral taxon 380 str. F0488]
MIFNFGKVCSDRKAKVRRTMSGSTVALQWLYSGSTVGLQWLYSGSTLTNRLRISEGKRNKRRCEPHRQMKNERRMIEPMEKVR